jgi:exopolysaccharide production negative regulator
MRISSALVSALAVGLVFGAGPSGGFDGNSPSNSLSPSEAFRGGLLAPKVGSDKTITSLQYAADNGDALAQYKLGRMYADGDGVPHNDLRAFEYFRRIVKSHSDDTGNARDPRFVADAFVALGHYYRDGIPNSPVKPDPHRARAMFSYAASYFGDPDAQFHLGRLYLMGEGVPKDSKSAARWLALAADKGQYEAQATLGEILFRGDEKVPRRRALGLMWLTLASDGSGDQVPWIADAREAAFKQATEDERALALTLIERHLNRPNR